MPLKDRVAAPLAIELLKCLNDAVNLLEKPPADRMLRSGNIVNFLVGLTKNECCAGLAWVRVDAVVPSSGQNWPAADLVPLPRGCATQRYAVRLEMGIVRCAPVASTTIPTDDQWNISAVDTLDDMAAMQKAICCMRDLLEPNQLILEGSWEPLAVQGMCVGGILPVTISAAPCNCLDDESPASM